MSFLATVMLVLASVYWGMRKSGPKLSLVESRLISAAQTGNTEAVEECLAEGADVNIEDEAADPFCSLYLCILMHNYNHMMTR